MSLALYQNFLINNISTISNLESSLRSITWFLPGRFKDAELASETLTALVNVLGMYHDTLLARVVQNNPKYKPLIPSSLHTRYTRAWSDQDIWYKWAARILEFLRHTELVFEMGLRRKLSSLNRWRGILLLEFIKAALRLSLLRITRRPVISPPIPERDIDPSVLPPLTPSSPSPPPPSSGPPQHLKNNHVPIDTQTHSLLGPHPPPLGDSVEQYLLPKALSTSDVKISTSVVKVLTNPKDWFAEIIYILRPLLYVALLTYDPPRSKRPLVMALAIEIISRNLRRMPPVSATLERSEYARRDRNIIWYLFRDTIWHSFTRIKLETFVNATVNAPLLGLISLLVKDWIPLIDEYHYYTAP